MGIHDDLLGRSCAGGASAMSPRIGVGFLADNANNSEGAGEARGIAVPLAAGQGEPCPMGASLFTGVK